MPTFPLNQILYGPPGTGKTYHTRALAVAICENRPVAEIEAAGRDEVNRRYRELEKKGQIVFTTFHQSLGYEDFVEGIKPSKKPGREMAYDIEPGILKRVAEYSRTEFTERQLFDKAFDNLLVRLRAGERIELLTRQRKRPFILGATTADTIRFIIENKESGTDSASTGSRESIYHAYGPERQNHYIYKQIVRDVIMASIPERKRRPHVLIMDEINRGNVSAIFGELITLIEDGKRAGQDEEIEVTLPYSQEKFKLPANLYLIGTMNTADRSVEALDTALRRRFVFREMMPEPKLLADLGLGVDMELLLTELNARLTYLKDKNHTLGHAFFLKCTSALDVIKVIAQKVLPLLEEFFYGETVKIGLVLSPAFLYKQDRVTGSALFGGERGSIAENLGIDLEETIPQRALTGPELLQQVGEDEGKALELIRSILA